jgi:hypothetical protein
VRVMPDLAGRVDDRRVQVGGHAMVLAITDRGREPRQPGRVGPEREVERQRVSTTTTGALLRSVLPAPSTTVPTIVAVTLWCAAKARLQV